MSRAPIGVFDSGIGGLTVMRELIGALPDEGIVYLGDTARVPYGIRTPDTVKRYAAEGAAFLLGKGIKLLVVACNTMSAVGLDVIRAMTDVPVIGVIEPGARAAVKSSRGRRIGVIGTEATIRSNAYADAIKSLNPSIEVIGRPCPLFVPLAEEGWVSGDVPRLVASRYLDDFKRAGIDALVLGCTHYPLLKPVISEVLGQDIKLIDSATETAAMVKETIGAVDEGRGGEAQREFYVTDGPEKFKSVGERFLTGLRIDSIKLISLEVNS